MAGSFSETRLRHQAPGRKSGPTRPASTARSWWSPGRRRGSAGPPPSSSPASAPGSGSSAATKPGWPPCRTRCRSSITPERSRLPAWTSSTPLLSGPLPPMWCPPWTAWTASCTAPAPSFGTTGPPMPSVELTVATHVLAPFRLTALLSPLLRAAAGFGHRHRVVGRDVHPALRPRRPGAGAAHYRGVTAYARAKRAQVVLAAEWARRWRSDGVASYAMHPGWVDTPGLTEGLPAFGRIKPVLRSPDEGADTAVWLAAGGPYAKAGSSRQADCHGHNGFWHDRPPPGVLPTVDQAQRATAGRRRCRPVVVVRPQAAMTATRRGRRAEN